MKTTTAADLDKAVAEQLDAFYMAKIEDLQEAAKKAADWAKKELKATSPRGKGKKSGNYAKAWKVKVQKLRLGTNTIVYNDGLYMLSHLLEYGHPKTNGGRTKANNFIKPVEEKANSMFYEEMKRRIQNGS